VSWCESEGQGRIGTKSGGGCLGGRETELRCGCYGETTLGG
jgi:hypothetical protein